MYETVVVVILERYTTGGDDSDGWTIDSHLGQQYPSALGYDIPSVVNE
jgi:hypothetical protein